MARRTQGERRSKYFLALELTMQPRYCGTDVTGATVTSSRRGGTSRDTAILNLNVRAWCPPSVAVGEAPATFCEATENKESLLATAEEKVMGDAA